MTHPRQAGLINERGQVVGWSYVNSVPSAICPGIGGPVLPTDSFSFIWDKNSGMKDLGGLGGTCTLANDVNNRGQIVGGSALTGDPQIHPFVWDAATGVMDLLDASDGSYGFAEGINSRPKLGRRRIWLVKNESPVWRPVSGKSVVFEASRNSSLPSPFAAFRYNCGNPLLRVELKTTWLPSGDQTNVVPRHFLDRIFCQ